MKLLVETHFNGLDIVAEAVESTGEKTMYIEGIFMQSNIKNRNGRIYPEENLDNAVKKYVAEYVVPKRALGELNHSESSSVNPERAAIFIEKLEKKNHNWHGRAKVLKSTDQGRVTSGLMSEGVKLGISSRGLGSLKEDRGGTNIVQNDFFLITAGDVVHDPSAPEAFLESVMEQKEWVMVNDTWVPKHLEETRKRVSTTKTYNNKKLLDEMRLREFRKFMNSL